MNLHDEVRIHLLEESFHYSVLRRGLEIESAEVPLSVDPEPILADEYYGGTTAID